MKKNALRNLTTAAIIAALYAALTLLVAPLSFGAVQIRFSEALTVLPAVCPPAVAGLSVGCFLSNLIGFLAGLNPLGLIDSVVGMLATLLAALVTYYIGKHVKGRALYLLAPLPPILLNGIIIGAEIAIVFLGSTSALTVIVSCAYVALGELIACYLGGSLLLKGAGAYFKKHFN